MTSAPSTRARLLVAIAIGGASAAIAILRFLEFPGHPPDFVQVWFGARAMLDGEIDAVEPEQVTELAGLLLAPERLSAAGVGPREERFLDAVERLNPALVARAAA